MRRWLSFPLVFVLAFAGLLGFFSWKTYVSHVRPDYRLALRWTAPWISPPTGELPQAYFRKKIYFNSQPLSAWVTVIAPDDFVFFVNGNRIPGPSYDSGYTQAVFDIAQFLKPGTNVLAIRNDVATYHQRPRIAVQGRYVDWTGYEGVIQSDATWRTAWRNESLNSEGGIVHPIPWVRPDFDDGRWPYVTEGEVPNETITKAFAFSPTLLTDPVRGPWIWADQPDAPEAFFRYSFDLEQMPRDAALRITAKRHYRVLVNGYFVAGQEQTIGTESAQQGPMRAYDINVFLRRGRNVVAVQASNTWSDRGLLIDGWIDRQDGIRQVLYPSDWKVAVTPPAGWVSPAFDDSRWSPAAIPKPLMRTDQPILVVDQGTITRPLGFELRLIALYVLHLAAALALSLLLWTGTARVLSALTEEPTPDIARWLGLTYLPSTVLLIALYLLSFDPRFAVDFPYRPRFLGASVLLVAALQLTLLVAAAAAKRGVRPRLSLPGKSWRGRPAWARGAIPVTILLAGLLVAGFALRYKDLGYEPLGGDETSAALYSSGIWDRGYPSVVVNGKSRPALTSEFTLYMKAPLNRILGPAPLGQRLTDVIFGTLTILLLYWTGRLFHSGRVGLLAAAVYTFLPSQIGMTDYSRYPSQQQFFTLLTTAFFFLAFRDDRFRPREFYLACIGCLAVYLSWEGGAFFLPAVGVGVLLMTRPNFSWLKNPHLWGGVLPTVTLVFVQFGFRLIEQSQRLVYGSGARDANVKLVWLYPFYDPYFYVHNFFLLENHHVLSLIFILGIPLWFRRSRECRILGFVAAIIVTHLTMATNLLELSEWRYVYLLFALEVLAASMTLVIFLDYLSELARPVRVPANVVRWCRYATAAALVGCVLVFSTAFLVKLYNLPDSTRSLKTRLWTRIYPSMETARDYLRAFRMPGDVVIAINPHVWLFLDEPADYFVQSQLRLSLNLGPDPGPPIHRMSGVQTILSAEELREVLAHSPRVWLVSYGPVPPAVEKALGNLIQDTLRPVYEDFSATIYLLGERTPLNGQNGPKTVGWAREER